MGDSRQCLKKKEGGIKRKAATKEGKKESIEEGHMHLWCTFLVTGGIVL